VTGHHLLAVWPVTRDHAPLEDLVEIAAGELREVAAEAGARVAGLSTWRLIDADGLEGWEHHDGRLLIATAPAEPLRTVSPASLLTERFGPLDDLEAERPPVDLTAWCHERAEAHRDYEDHELPEYEDRDVALVGWVVRVLGSPALVESRRVLEALATNHGLTLQAA
jgi:hypothetical protein